MSDVPKTVEEAPAVEATPVTAASEEPAAAENTNIASDAAPEPAKEETVKSTPAEAATETTSTSEGILGYKAPSLIPRIRFSELFFWFSEEACKPENLQSYFRNKEGKVAHPTAAWAQQTGKGLLFYAKRAEDKSSPTGIINLSDISDVTKDGTTEFVFKAHGHKHVFQAANSKERDSWVAAVEKGAEEGKSLREEIVGSEAYKKHIDAFLKAPVAASGVAATGAAAVAAAKHETESKPAETTTNGVTKDAPEVPAAAEAKKDKEAKSRSQSRKRSSIFGSLLGKKEEEKAEDKADKKAEKKVEKEQKAEEKKVEKEQKKEEAKATNEPSKAVEAGAAGVAATVPAAVIAAEHKKDEKDEETKPETTTPTEKKGKRGSIFGSLFTKKDATGAPVEKDAAAKDAEVPAVSESAPKLEEPIVNKPIDTAAVTAPVDTVQTPPAAEETAKENGPAETATTPTKEKKGGFLGFIKKQEAKFEGKKEQKKEEKAAEQITKDPVVAAAATETPAASTEAATTPPAEPAPEGRERRRSSFFGLGALKRKTSEQASEDEAAPAETKRDKSPLPQKIGGLFRKPSKAAKGEEKKEEPADQPTEAQSDTVAVTNGETAPVGDEVPTVHEAVTMSPEVKATA